MLQLIKDSVILQVIWAIGILLLAALIAWLVLLSMRRAQRRLIKRKKTKILSQFIQCLARPVFVLILVQGLILSLSTLPFLETWRGIFGQVSITITIILVTYALARVVTIGLEWYLSSRVVQKAAAIDAGLMRFLKRVVLMVVYVLGILVLLDYLNVSISPILAGLGIGGLAIALALQPLLSNFFAGTQIVSDRIVRVGDYVQLEDNLEGHVIDVGWRSTRIRTLFDTIVIIPNARLADSIITNYHAPDTEVQGSTSISVKL